ncbi:MAG: cyclic nucleotide-binding domain-containing protein [Verrucomicrobiota bacterium]|jgi:CRP-like cAMP-binding protein
MPEILETSEILPPLGILAHVTPGSRAALTDGGEFVHYAKGEAVLQQGEATGHLFIVVSGELAVTLRSPEQLVPLGYIHEGETVGEMGFLEEVEASAFVAAAVPSKVWQISRDAFEVFLTKSPVAGNELLKEIVKLLSRRARKGHERLTEAE